MLKEIEHSRARGCRWYYPGYATQGSSAYDYKKQFGALEFLDWESGEWGRVEEVISNQ
jgi:arginine-tRNA-protein transferase